MNMSSAIEGNGDGGRLVRGLWTYWEEQCGVKLVFGFPIDERGPREFWTRMGLRATTIMEEEELAATSLRRSMMPEITPDSRGAAFETQLPCWAALLGRANNRHQCFEK